MTARTEIPGRWQLDELARQVRALQAAEDELAAALAWIVDMPIGSTSEQAAQALDRYVLALTERNALRDGTP